MFSFNLKVELYFCFFSDFKQYFMNLFILKNYKSVLDVHQTEHAIEQIKDFFQLNLSSELRLRRVTAPLFVKRGTGVNDDLNGIERPV